MSQLVPRGPIVNQDVFCPADLPRLVRRHRELRRQIDGSLGHASDYGELCALAQQAAHLGETITSLVVQRRRQSRDARRVFFERGSPGLQAPRTPSRSARLQDEEHHVLSL
jgi:hypothetical protein